MRIKQLSFGVLGLATIGTILYLVRQKKLLSSFGYLDRPLLDRK